MKRLVWILCYLLVALCAQASSPSLRLMLEGLSPYKVSERGGDELYMDFLVYPSKAKAKHFRVPKKPLHWPSFMINKLHDVELWQGTLPNGDKVTIHGALLEKDAPPWNRDELIGSFVLSLSNKDGNIQYALQEDKEDKLVYQPLTKSMPTIEMTGNNSHYALKLKLVGDKPKSKKKK